MTIPSFTPTQRNTNIKSSSTILASSYTNNTSYSPSLLHNLPCCVGNPLVPSTTHSSLPTAVTA
jgi:hypothetical protein